MAEGFLGHPQVLLVGVAADYRDEVLGIKHLARTVSVTDRLLMGRSVRIT